MASETRNATLLKIISLLFLIWAIANIFVILGIDSCSAIAGNALLNSAGAGVAIANVLQISKIVYVIFMLIAGAAGLKARNRSLCNICGTIILICAIVMFLNHVDGDWSVPSIVSSLVSVALPVLYFIGVRNAF
ncbi:MAG: hypothetical protein IJJ92_08290 [Clostridia bacterium]|nr:hypothetical protein [Clostridia bacterium]